MIVFIIPALLFQNRLDTVKFGFGQMFDVDEIVARIVDGADQFVQLRLYR